MSRNDCEYLRHWAATERAMAQAATHPRAISAHRPMAERYEALSKKHEPALVVSIGPAIRMSVAASSSIFQRHCCEETTDEGTAQYVNRSSGMGNHYDRPADEMKLEARRFQEELRRALAPQGDEIAQVTDAPA